MEKFWLTKKDAGAAKNCIAFIILIKFEVLFDAITSKVDLALP
jgi:hypothetical protein